MMIYPKRQRFIIGLINYIVIITFLWSNLVWAGGVDYYNLSAPSQVTSLVPIADTFATGQDAVMRLADAGVKTKEGFYSKLNEVLKEGKIEELAGVPVLVFSDKDDPTRLAYYVFSSESYISRITNTRGKVNDPFWNVIGGEGIIVSPDTRSFEYKGKRYFQEVFLAKDQQVVNFIHSCFDMLKSGDKPSGGSRGEGDGIVYSHTIDEEWKVWKVEGCRIEAEVDFFSGGEKIGEGKIDIDPTAASINTCWFKSFREGQHLGLEMASRMYVRAHEISKFLGLGTKYAHAYFTRSQMEEIDGDYRTAEGWKKYWEKKGIEYSLFRKLGLKEQKLEGKYHLRGYYDERYYDHIAPLEDVVAMVNKNWQDWFYKDRVISVFGKDEWEREKDRIEWDKVQLEIAKKEDLARRSILDQILSLKSKSDSPDDNPKNKGPKGRIDGILKQYGYNEDEFEKLKEAYKQGRISISKNCYLGGESQPDFAPSRDSDVASIPDISPEEERQEMKRNDLAYLLLNGGLATRFGETIKSLFEAFRFKGQPRSFAEVKFATIRFLNRVFGIRIPIDIMNSYSTNDITNRFLEERDHFGLPLPHIFTQGISRRLYPTVSDLEAYVSQEISKRGDRLEELRRKVFGITDEDDNERTKLLLEIQELKDNLERWKDWVKGREGEPYESLVPEKGFNPPGHGDLGFNIIQDPLDRRVLLENMKEGKEFIGIANIDNLTSIPDAALKGQLRESGKELLVELALRYPGDIGGALARVTRDGVTKMGIVEDFAFPIEFKHSDPNSPDYISRFNTNTYIVKVTALLRLFGIITPEEYTEYEGTQGRNRRRLWKRFIQRYQDMSSDELKQKVDAVKAMFPVYAVMKTVTEKSIDDRTGEIKEIPVPVIQFERLMGDLTWFLDTIYVQIDREKRFHPIKTPSDLLKAWPKLVEVLEGRLDFPEVIYDKEGSLKTLYQIQRQGIDTISLSSIEDPDLPRVDIEYAMELVEKDRALIARFTDEERFYLRLASYNLEDDIHLPIELVKETGALVLNPRLPKAKPVWGRLNEAPWYYYPDVRLITDESYLRQNNLRFDIFVVGQTVGDENEYPRSPVFNIQGEYPALLQVSKGKCIFLLQLQDPNNPSHILETKIVEVREKERVAIPAGCRFTIANLGNEPLIVAGWLSRDAKVSYTYEFGDNVEFQEKIAERLSPLTGISPSGIIWSRPIYDDLKSFRVDEILRWLNEPSVRKGSFYNPYQDEPQQLNVAKEKMVKWIRTKQGLQNGREIGFKDILKAIANQTRSKEKILKEHKEFILTGLNWVRELLQVGDIASLPITHIFRDLKIVATEIEDSDLRDLCLVVITEFLNRLKENKERLTIDQLPEVFCGLFTYLIEMGPGRHETSYLLAVSETAKKEFGRINESMRRTRQLVVDVLASYFGRDEFRDIEVFIRKEILPFLNEVATDSNCYAGLRAGLVALIYDDLHLLKFRTENHVARDLIDAIYTRKYQRFGTSGVRARVGLDFSNEIAALIAEEMARFFKEESGLLEDKQRTIVIGYDTRKGVDKYARLCAAAAIMAGFKVQLFNHPIPTGALIQWAVKKVGFDNLAGIINCTSSHNPYPWVGIRVSPRYGGPAGTDLTEFITKRINERILVGDISEISQWKGWDKDDYMESSDIKNRFTQWEEEGVFEIIGDKQATKDRVAMPMEEYIDYAVELVKLVLGDEIQQEMADYYRDKKLVIDSMYGASQGYAEAILAKLGVSRENIVTVHGERNPDLLRLEDGTRIPSDPGVEEFLAKTGTLDKAAEVSMGGKVSVSGTAMDTDGDRMAGFGVSEDGKTLWFTPNKIFTALIYHIITDRNTQNKDFIIVKSGPSTLWIDLILSKLKQNPRYSQRLVTPQELPIAGYEVSGNPEFHNPTYQLIHSVGDIPLVSKDLTEYLTDVGFKYVATTMLNGLDPKAAIMAGRKIQLAIGFEESAGFAIAIEEVDTEGNIYRLFVPDKDGLIATALFYAIQAREKKNIIPIISDIEKQFGELNSERLDVIASTKVKVDIINSLLSEFSKGLHTRIAGFKIRDIQHIGGIYYDRFNLLFIDKKTNTPVTFKIRMSGTEPLVRVYIEARDKEILERFLREAKDLILECNIRAIENAPTRWSLVDQISLIELTEENMPLLQKAVQDRLQKGNMPENESIHDIVEKFIANGSLEEKYVGPRSKVEIAKSLRKFFRDIDDPIGSGGSNKPIRSKPLRFGTSGLRGLVRDMTDLECYINVKGYIDYLKRIGKTEGGIEEGATIYIGGDLRSSTDRIMKAVARAIEDSGCKVNNCGLIPTSALAYYAMQNGCAGIMVTGSHVADDSNGIKPYKTNGEVLKSDEPGIIECVEGVRAQEYAKLGTDRSLFNQEAMFESEQKLPEVDKRARAFYIKHYLDIFPLDCLKGKRIVVYEHSAVGRDILVEILKGLGAEVIAVGRTDDKFIPVDTEAIRPEDVELIKEWAKQYRPFAVLSTDGDSDRPWLSDESGKFLRGDKLGILAAMYLDADFAAVPISSNDAIDIALGNRLSLVKTMIGSPYVISAMIDAVQTGFKKVIGWEGNGGFLTQSEFAINGKILKALPTRDAVLPLICALLLAVKGEKSVSEFIDTLPKRFAHSDLIKFPMEMEEFQKMSKAIIKNLSPEDENIDQIHFDKKGITVVYKQNKEVLSITDQQALGFVRKKKQLEKRYFNPEGFKEITSMIFTDGVRIIFKNRDVIHFRPSGNAPEFRCYSNADTEDRSEEIVTLGLKNILPKMKEDILDGFKNTPPEPIKGMPNVNAGVEDQELREEGIVKDLDYYGDLYNQQHRALPGELTKDLEMVFKMQDLGRISLKGIIKGFKRFESENVVMEYGRRENEIRIDIFGEDKEKVRAGIDTISIIIKLAGDDYIDSITMTRDVFSLSRSMVSILLHRSGFYKRFPLLYRILREQFVLPKPTREMETQERITNSLIDISKYEENAVKGLVDEELLSNLRLLRYSKSQEIRRKALRILSYIAGKGFISKDEFRMIVGEFFIEDIREDLKHMERLIRNDIEFVRNTFKNLFGKEVTLPEINNSEVRLRYMGRGNNKQIYKVEWRINQEVYRFIISVIRDAQLGQGDFSKDKLGNSLNLWNRLSRMNIPYVPRLGAGIWDIDYRGKTVRVGGESYYKYTESNIQIVSREYIEGATLEEVLLDEAIPEEERNKARLAGLNAFIGIWKLTRDKNGKGVFMTTPKPNDIVVFKDLSGEWQAKVIDLDALEEEIGIDRIIEIFSLYSWIQLDIVKRILYEESPEDATDPREVIVKDLEDINFPIYHDPESIKEMPDLDETNLPVNGYEFSFDKPPFRVWDYEIKEKLFKVGKTIPEEPEDYIPVIEDVLRDDENFLKETFKNLFNLDISKGEVDKVRIRYWQSGRLKHVFIVTFLFKDKREYTFLIKPTIVGIDEEDREDILKSIWHWRNFSGSVLKNVTKYGSKTTVYFEDFHNESMIISQEFVPGRTLYEIIKDENIAPEKRTIAIQNAYNEYLELREKQLIAITDPKPENIVAVNGNISEWKIIDMDRLRMGSELSIEEYVEVLDDYYPIGVESPSSENDGFIIRGEPEVLYRLEEQKDEITDLRPEIDREDVVKKLRDILERKRNEVGDKETIRKIEQAIDDLETFDIKEFNAIVLNWYNPRTERERGGQWLLGFNSIAEHYLQKLFPKPTLGYAREVLDNLKSTALLEYLLHEALCTHTGHYRARRIQEILFEESNYKGAKGEAGSLNGVVNKVLTRIINRKIMKDTVIDFFNDFVELLFDYVDTVLTIVFEDIPHILYYPVKYVERRKIMKEMHDFVIRKYGSYPKQSEELFLALYRALLKLKGKYKGGWFRGILDPRSLPYLLHNFVGSWFEYYISDKWQRNEHLELFDEGYVNFTARIFFILKKLKNLYGKDNEEFDEKINKFIELGNSSCMGYLLEFILDKYAGDNNIREHLIDAISKMKGRHIENAIIDLFKYSNSFTVKEDTAIVLSQWCAQPESRTRRGKRARNALAKVLGKKRTSIFDRYGVWIIDYRVGEKYKFREDDIDRMEKVLEKIPEEHLKGGLCRVMVRSYLNEYIEELPRWVWETKESQIIDCLGTYNKKLRMVMINEIEDIERVVCHEIGHGVYHFCLTDEQRDGFNELHKQSVERLPLPSESNQYGRLIDYFDFSYSYGAVNEKEDFATIYEMWLANREFLEREVLNSELLSRKHGIVMSTTPSWSVRQRDVDKGLQPKAEEIVYAPEEPGEIVTDPSVTSQSMWGEVYEIRLANNEDIPAIININKKVGMKRSEKFIRDRIAGDKGKAIVVIDNNGRVVGYGTYKEPGSLTDSDVTVTDTPVDKIAYLSMMAVDPHYQEQGIGTLMIQEIFQRALDFGAERVALHVRETRDKAIRFYEKIGRTVAPIVYKGTKGKFKDTGEKKYEYQFDLTNLRTGKHGPIAKKTMDNLYVELWEVDIKDLKLQEGRVLHAGQGHRKIDKIDKGLLEVGLNRLVLEYGQGILTIVDAIRVVDNIPLTLTLSPVGRGMGEGVLPYGCLIKEDGKNILLLDVDAFSNEELLYIVLEHELKESIMGVVPCENNAIRELTTNFMSLKLALEKGIKIDEAQLEALGADLQFFEALEILQAMAEVTDEQILATAIEHMRGMPYYAELFRQFSFAGEWQDRIKDAENRYKAALQVFNEIMEAKEMASKVRETEAKVDTKIKGLSQSINKVRMIVSTKLLWEGNLVDALVKNNKYIRLDRDELAKSENKYIMDWINRVTEGKERSPFIFSDEDVPEWVRPEDVIHLIEPGRVTEGLPQGKLYLPLPYSISSIYLASQVVLAGGKVSGITDKLALNTIKTLYETLLGRDITEEELEQLFRSPWIILPEIAQITSTLNAMRKAIVEIEKSA